MERFEDYARHRRTTDMRTRVLRELEERLEGGLTPHPRLDTLASQLRRRRTTMLPVPEVPCVALFGKRAPLGAVFDGPVIGIHGRLLDTASNPHLAFILAHELAHVALGHIEETRRKHPRLSGFRKLMGALKTPLDRRELDADRLAYRWLSDAGLETGAWEFFHLLRLEYEKAGHRVGIEGLNMPGPAADWLYRHLRTHPSIDERLWQLRVLDPYGEGRAEDAMRKRKRNASKRSQRKRSTNRSKRRKRKRK